MGLDIEFGMLYGLEFYTGDNPIFEDCGLEKFEELRYNPYTGTPYTIYNSKYMLKFKYDFLEYKCGDKVTIDDFMDFLAEFVRNKRIEKKPHIEKLIFSERFVGIRAYKGKEFYGSPQDWCFEYIPEENAQQIWDELFPDLPGKFLLFVRASY